MSGELIVIVVIYLIWFIRLEIKFHDLKIRRHYKLYTEDGYAVSHLYPDGTLGFTIAGNKLMGYRTASGIKKLYPELRMVNDITGEEVE